MSRARELSIGLGAGALAFGVAPLLAPGWFGRLFQIPVGTDPRLEVMVRSVGVRDAAIGTGLLLTAAGGQDYLPWLLARIASDLGDALAVGIALGAGPRPARFVGLGGLALGAGVVGALIYRAARAD